MTEVCRLANAEVHPLDEGAIVQKNMSDTDRMKLNKASMLLDFEAGRPLEVEAILGTATRIARKHALPTPFLDTLYALLHLAAKPENP